LHLAAHCPCGMDAFSTQKGCQAYAIVVHDVRRLFVDCESDRVWVQGARRAQEGYNPCNDGVDCRPVYMYLGSTLIIFDNNLKVFTGA
jgi:hypothetical protein